MTAAILYLDGYRISRADGGARIRDVEVAEKLGLAKLDLRRLIRRHWEELNDYGVVGSAPETHSERGGRPVIAYWLNRDQVLAVCMWSQTKAARLVRRELIQIFNAYTQQTERPASRCYIAEVLRLDAPSDWAKMWPDTFLQSICKLKRQPFTGRQPGGWMGKVYNRVYRLLLGDDVFDVVRELNPNPAKGSNHHQRLREEARERVQAEIHLITAFANTCGSYAEFWEKLEHHYHGTPLQLRLTGRGGE